MTCGRFRDAEVHGRPKVVVTGDFFLRFSPSFMEGVYQRYAHHGIILVPVGLNELLLYGAYSGHGQPPGLGLAAGFRVGGGPGLHAGLSAGRASNYLTSWAQ